MTDYYYDPVYQIPRQKGTERREGCFGNAIRYGVGGGIIAVLLWVLFGLVGCKSQYLPGTDTTTDITVRDREVPVVTPADSASILALLECDSLNRVVMRELEIEKGKRIVPTIKPVYIPASTPEQPPQLQLQFDCKEDSLEHIIHVQDSIINRLRVERTEPVMIKEKGFVYYCGVAFIVIICLVFVWNVAKVVLKFYGIKS